MTMSIVAVAMGSGHLALPVLLVGLVVHLVVLHHCVTVRDQILPRSPDRTPSVISDFPHGTSQHVLVFTWARHSFLSYHI